MGHVTSHVTSQVMCHVTSHFMCHVIAQVMSKPPLVTIIDTSCFLPQCTLQKRPDLPLRPENADFQRTPQEWSQRANFLAGSLSWSPEWVEQRRQLIPDKSVLVNHPNVEVAKSFKTGIRNPTFFFLITLENIFYNPKKHFPYH